MTSKITLTTKEATWIAYRLHDLIKNSSLSDRKMDDISSMRDRLFKKIADAKDSALKPVEVETLHGKYMVVWDSGEQTDKLIPIKLYNKKLKELRKEVRAYMAIYEVVVTYEYGQLRTKLVNKETGEVIRRL